MSAAAAWTALQQTLFVHDPACRDDLRFTDDGRSDAFNSDLVPICAACPVMEQCAAYAAAAPRYSLTGFWAGRRRGTRRRPESAP